MSFGKKLFLGAFLASFAAFLLILTQAICLRAWVWNGILVDECPAGALVPGLHVEAYGLQRGAEGIVRVRLLAHYTEEASDSSYDTTFRRGSARLALVSGAEERPLVPVKGWERAGDQALVGQVVLPEALPDGEYLLRVRAGTPAGEVSHDVPLEVFAPARVHVITDRPLYEPGHTVQFRAVALRARDLAPLDGRPGRFFVYAPSGETVLEEKAPAGDFGVVAGSFPLDEGAPTGVWRVAWASGAARDEVTFRVEPFQLPRLKVEASAVRTFYGRGEVPVLRGAVTYASGAPVSGAALDLSWRVDGAWPAPTEWMAGGLPQAAVADAGGRFELRLPEVPRDLRGQATLRVRIGAKDLAGDRVEGAASILLSKDAIKAEAVTELGEGLVEGFNNRLYLRVSRADGVPLPSAAIRVRRAWDATDPGIAAETDEDGVASLQIDPGPPVNVVVPAMPARLPLPPPAVELTEVGELVSGEATLADRVAVEGALKALAPCARFAAEQTQVEVALRVDAAGAVRGVSAGGELVERCAAGVLGLRRLAPGAERILTLSLSFTPDHPSFGLHLEGAPEVPELVDQAFNIQALDARACLAVDAEEAALPRLFLWRLAKGSHRLEVTVARDGAAEAPFVSAAVAACVEQKVLAAKLPPALPEDEPPDRDHYGLLRLEVQPRAVVGGHQPADTTFLGYELKVEARAGDESIGETELLTSPGYVPPVRLRATPVLAEAGQSVEIALLRGPGFQQALPEKLYLRHDRGTLEALLDPETKVARFVLPADVKGWLEATFSTGRAVVWVRPKHELAVEVTPNAPKYRPGERAALKVRTRSGGQPGPAAVGLFGLDESLGQLASLPGADDMARLKPRPSLSSSAFGVIDAEALVMGRIRGAHAAAATVLRVTSLPEVEDLDARISASGATAFDPVGPLTDRFYAALGAFAEEMRQFEAKAPASERVTPATVAKLWRQALAALSARGEPAVDAFGRELRLHRLPEDLLALLDPRVVVLDGTRLPEDVEPWIPWVRKEQP